MGIGSSFLRHNDEDDVLGVEYGSSQGVIKRIPIEVKPRGRLGLRSVRSMGKPKVGGSLRSALSVDLENPEVERIRKDFEMYRLNKENEIANMQKKVQKLETENKRLRGELQALQKTCRKLREERDSAIEAEHQALVRAAAFENDRDKVQRQFKIFRETKESELQNLLKARRDLEGKLSRAGHVTVDDFETASRIESSLGGGNPGDWWAALESEPSLGSTTQLHTTPYRGPEFAHSMEMESPYIHVNKDDWNVASATLAQVFPTIPESLQTNTIRIFLSAAVDTEVEVKVIMQKHEPALVKLCVSEGRFFDLVYMPCNSEDFSGQNQDKYVQARCRQIDQATIFLAVLAGETHRYTNTDCGLGHLNDPGAKPAIFCFRSVDMPSCEMNDLRKKVKDSGSVKVIDDYVTAEQGMQLAYNQIEKIVKSELGLEQKGEADSPDNVCELDGPESLCGRCLWDTNYDYEQIEAWNFAKRSTCELGFEKHYERLSAYVSEAGPLPPLLISGVPGTGKSLLLAKWIELQQQRTSGVSVLYHFVGSESSCSADPLIMIRRLTAQLMQHVTSPPTLTCDPVRLVEEFPKWLEKVSAKMASGVVLVLDGADRFQNGEAQLAWLLDPLPVDCRFIISVHESTCPQSWRSWPTIHLEELSNKHVKELLRAELASLCKEITVDQENQILTHCRTASTCAPLYVVVLAKTIAMWSDEDGAGRLDTLISTQDCVQLYKVILNLIRQDHEETKGMVRKVLKLMYACRNGLSESELMQLVPGLSWNFWAPLVDALLDSHVVTYRSGLLVFTHVQAREAVREKCFHENEQKLLQNCRRTLREFFNRFTGIGDVTYRVADELPFINRQLEDKEPLHENVRDLCIFVKHYCRGRSAELLSYWHYVGVDRTAMAQEYFSAAKHLESLVGQCNSLVTLPKVADLYEALGRFLRDLGLLSEALTLLQRALEIRETALDPDHPSVAHILHLVAGLHAQWNKYSTAEALYKQAMEIYEGAYGTEHFCIAREFDALAMLYHKQGKHNLAEPLHKRALSIRRSSKMARVGQGRVRGVDPVRRRVLQLEELAMVPDSADLAKTLNDIGVLYYLQNNVESAESFFRRSLEMREAVLGSDHPDCAQSLNNLAALYNDRKQYDKALPLYERARDIRQKYFSPDHPSVSSVVKHLGMLYKKMGKLEEAEPMYNQIVEIREKNFGSSHPALATALVNLAVLHSQQGHHSMAQPLYDRALKIYEESFGPNHPRVSETLRNLALSKYEQGEFETAAQLYKRATEMKEGEVTDGKVINSRRSSTGETATTLRNSDGIHVQPDSTQEDMT